MADVNRGKRPLSPFMIGPYYRPQLTSMTSILTRISGNALLLGALMLVWWLLAAASGPEYFATVDWIWTSFIGKLIQLGSVWALWYHVLAGARHLYWDTGRGLDVETAETLGIACIAGSIVLTVLTFIVL